MKVRMPSWHGLGQFYFCKEPLSGQVVTQPKFELGTYKTQILNVTATRACSAKGKMDLSKTGGRLVSLQKKGVNERTSNQATSYFLAYNTQLEGVQMAWQTTSTHSEHIIIYKVCYTTDKYMKGLKPKSCRDVMPCSLIDTYKYTTWHCNQEDPCYEYLWLWEPQNLKCDPRFTHLCSEAIAGALLLVKMESLLRISGRSQMVWLGATTSETFSGMMRPRSLLMPRLRCSMSALRDALRTSSSLPRPISISDWERVCRLAVRVNVDGRTEPSWATDLRGNVLQYVL